MLGHCDGPDTGREGGAGAGTGRRGGGVGRGRAGGADVKWFRFYSEALHDPKVRLLSNRLFRYWVNLLCLASMHERRGILPPLADVADGLQVPIKRAELGLAELVTLGFLDQTADGLMPHN